MKQLTAIIERDDTDEIAGRVDVPDHFLLTTVGNTEQEVIDNLRMLVADYILHEGAEFDDWRDVDAAQIEFNVEYERLQ